MANRYSKAELMRIMDKFLADKHRGISHKLFAELAGIHLNTLRSVFVTKKEPLSEYVQLRVSKAYDHVLHGRVKVMSYMNKHYVEYRKEPEPRIRRHTQLVLTPEGFKIHTGMRLKHDYSSITLDEQIRSKNGRFA